MRKYLYIFCALLAWLVLSSRSCVPDSEEMVSEETLLMETKESIKNEFESDELSEESLRAFEEKAKQKLVDLADYLNIYFDESMDKSFRTHTQQMILDLFVSDTVQINELLYRLKDKKSISLDKFLSKDPGRSGYLSIPILLDSVHITVPLHRTEEDLYEGKLSFSRYQKSQSTSDSIASEPMYMEAKIVTKKVSKVFGADTLFVWGVFLGDMSTQ